MSPSYRDDRDAALARVDALQRENERLRAENRWLHDQLDPDEPQVALARAHRRGAAVGVTVFLAALSCVTLIARDAASNVARADADLEFDLDPIARVASSVHALEAPTAVRALAPRVDRAVTPTAPRVEAAREVSAPMLARCFEGASSRVEVFARVDARGRAKQVHVFGAGFGSARAARRCARHALAGVTLPVAGAATVHAEGVDVRVTTLAAPHRRARRAR